MVNIAVGLIMFYFGNSWNVLQVLSQMIHTFSLDQTQNIECIRLDLSCYPKKSERVLGGGGGGYAKLNFRNPSLSSFSPPALTSLDLQYCLAIIITKAGARAGNRFELLFFSGTLERKLQLSPRHTRRYSHSINRRYIARNTKQTHWLELVIKANKRLAKVATFSNPVWS